MSLKLGNSITEKQKAFLKKLDYYGNLNLTQQEAAKLIDELLEQQRQERAAEEMGAEEYIGYTSKQQHIKEFEED